MSRLAGFTVLLAGLGVGGYLYYPDLVRRDATAFANASRLVAEDDFALRPIPASSPREATRTFSPQSPLFAAIPARKDAIPARKDAAPDDPPPAAESARRVAHVAPAQPVGDGAEGPRTATAWAATVQTATPPGTADGRHMNSSRPRDEEARVELIRDLQKQLKRVGCYDGEVDGSWGPASKRAMAAFTDRVNATLPVEEPDFILLTLVEGHRAAACGKGCPRGQVLSAGRCLPSAVVAKSERRGSRSSAGAVAAATESRREPARLAAPGSQAATAARAPRPEATVAEMSPPPQALRRADDILEGRMSIGGPALPPPEGRPNRTTGRERLAAASTDDDMPNRLPARAPAAPAMAAASPTADEFADSQRRERLADPPANRAPSRALHRAPAPRLARHAPEPRYVPRPSRPAFRSRSQRMVYDLFQRPDRIY